MADDGQLGEKQRVLIAGGGVAGVEAALALRDMAGDRLEVAFCDPSDEFAYRPFAIGEPYGTTRSFRYDMQRLSEHCGASFRRDEIVSVDPRQRLAATRDGGDIPYDYLIVATGVRMLWAVPGAVAYWGVTDKGQIAELICDLRAGKLRHVIFTAPGSQSWVQPLYGLALLAATELGGVAGGRTRVSVVTPENEPAEIFGHRAAEQLGALLAERGIEVIASARPIAFKDEHLRIATGIDIQADAVVSLPRLEGRRIAGIDHDRNGFISVDEQGAVVGQERIYAAGDVCFFPAKEGGIANQQADAVAEAVAAAAGAAIEPRPFDPVIRGVLWADREPLFLQGKPGDKDSAISGLSKQPAEPWGEARKPRITARYLTPFVDSLIAASGPEDFHETGAHASSAS